MRESTKNFEQKTKHLLSEDKESVDDVDKICQLLEIMCSVNINSPEAKLNETTISDGKGGRIFL